MKAILLIVTLLVIKFCNSQNLITNSSFEETNGCPSSTPPFNYLIDWINPTNASPDYWNSCYNSTIWTIGVPSNSMGFQEAYSGNAYAGFGVYNTYILPDTNYDYREYIQTELISQLEAEKKYKIIFYLSLPDKYIYSTNNIGIYFSQTEIYYNTNSILPISPQIDFSFTDSTTLTEKEKWIEISTNYIALGGEKFMTIGNFRTNENTDTINSGSGIYAISYYYIDDVSVTLDTTVGANEELTVKSEEYKIYPNPNTGTINISGNNNLESINLEIYSSLGQKVYIKSFNNSAVAKNIELNLPNGIYYCILRNDKGIVYNQKIVVQN